MSPLPGLRRFLTDMGRRAGGAGVALLLLSLLASLGEGVGLLLLVPLLGLLDGSARAPGGVLHAQWQALPLPHDLGGLLLLFLLLLLLQSGLVYARERAGLALRLRVSGDLQQHLHNAVMAMRWSAFSQAEPSRYSHALFEGMGRILLALQATQRLLTQGLLTLGYLAIALLLSPTFSLLAIGFGLLMLLLLLPLHHRAHHLGARQGGALRGHLRRLHQQLDGMRLIKSSAGERRALREFDASLREMHHLQRLQQHNSGLTQLLLRLGAGLALTGSLYLGATRFALDAPALLVLVYSFARLLPLLNGLQHDAQQLLHQLPAYDDYRNLLAECEAAPMQPHVRPTEPPAEPRSITVERLAFAYPARADDPPLTIDHLELPARETIAIIGPSGAGKSTLLDLLGGLLTPDSGSIHCAGTPLVEHHRTAHVAQEPFLFHASVRDNLGWVAPEADEAALWEALRLAAAEAFVRALPEGLDTRVGERGVQLSGGERQRLALARALLQRPSLLLLDEATSALDPLSEAAIGAALAELHGSLTIILVAHRPATVARADRVVVMKAGRVVEYGTRAVLRTDPTSYLHHLTSAQARDEL